MSTSNELLTTTQKARTMNFDKATAGFVKPGRQSSVVRTIVTGEGGRLIADVTTSHLARNSGAERRLPD